MRHVKLPFITLSLLALAACGTSRSSTAPADDTGILEPDTGYWVRNAPGEWVFDLGLGFPNDVQLSATGEGRGLLRVTLPEGATQATVRTLRVAYVRDADDATAATGAATWTFYADADGAPGDALGQVDVTVEAAQTASVDEASEPVVHRVPDVVVGATFWLGFSVRSGDPRVGGMYVNRGPDDVQFIDMFYQEVPGGPLEDPVNVRPYVGLSFTNLGR